MITPWKRLCNQHQWFIVRAVVVWLWYLLYINKRKKCDDSQERGDGVLVHGKTSYLGRLRSNVEHSLRF